MSEINRPFTVIELRHHNEVLDSILRQALAHQISIRVYASAFCYSASSFKRHADVKWTVMPQHQSEREFLLENMHSLQTSNRILIITPVEGLIDLANACNLPPSFCLIHNMNNFLSPPANKMALFGMMKQHQTIRPLLPDMQLSKHHAGYAAINIAFPEYSIRKSSPSREAIFTVAGRVYPGRDYGQFLAALELAGPIFNSSPVVHFLGETVPDLAFDRRFLIAKRYVNVVTYDRFVEQDVFDRVLANSDFLVLPLARSITYHGRTEIRGVTCISGNVNDFVRFGLPALVPRFYPLDESLEPLVGRFDTVAEMAELLVTWVNSRPFEQIRKKAQLHLDAYATRSLQRFGHVFGINQDFLLP
jgi:hypothetical protein